MDHIQILKKATSQEANVNTRPVRPVTYFQEFSQKESTTGDISEIFHESTKVDQVNPKFNRSIEQFERFSEETATAFIAGTDHRERPLVDLPDGDKPTGAVSDAILERRSVQNFERYEVPPDELSTLLQYGCGMVRDVMFEFGEHTHRARGYPSAGALYPIEPYIVLLDADRIDSGIYYYSAREHGLRVIEQADRETILERLDAFLDDCPPNLAAASLLFLMTGAFWKTKIKYGPRGYRFALLEAGHMAQNVQLVAAAMGFGTVSQGGLRESEVDEVLEVNGVDESTVYGFFVGKPAETGDTDG
ncbi:SagB/ThcOx family dehydrogenase [Halopiger goleimassiliensis]|uniref:SagB/ThcOx family dehydrogenase n=1 Tax=Halopiger goleimassiliensis TaxID=1293048 RepID=UPI000677F146|nr:SagB/ThcOx family dehydrogenase [Halopiger goleimassiliensis]